MRRSRCNAPAIAGLLLGASVASAVQAADVDEAAVLAAVERVVAEHRIYATCLSLEPGSYRLVQDLWAQDVKAASAVLRDARPSVGFVARFAAAVHPSRLIDEDRSLASAIAYCHPHETQLRKFHEYGFSRLATAVADALETTRK